MGLGLGLAGPDQCGSWKGKGRGWGLGLRRQLVCPCASASRSGPHAKWVETSKRALVLSRQAPGWSCTLAAMGMGAVSQPQFRFTTVTWKKSCWMPSTNLDGAAPRVLTVTGGCKHVPWAPLLLCREAGGHSSRPGTLALAARLLRPGPCPLVGGGTVPQRGRHRASRVSAPLP